MKHLILGTAGHIDHGKTTLVKALTGIDCDTHKEEKKRGITINLGFSFLNLPGGESLGIVDVPGHKDFINTMVGGACGIDLVMLVIAADSGIMPQTREHMNIINSLGIRHGVVALTKADLVDEELVELARMEIREFLEDSAFPEAPVIPVSATRGQGLEDLKAAIESVLPEVEERSSEGAFRLYIDRIFTKKGFGSVVTGSVMSGNLKAETEVYLLPGDYPPLRVRSLERHGRTVGHVVAGDRAAINLSGLNLEDFRRGMVLCDRRQPATNRIDASVGLFDKGVKLPLWSHVTFHTGTFESPARMHAITKDSVEAGEEVVVQIHLERPAILAKKDRFILRNSSGDRSLGGGLILDNAPLNHRKRTAALIKNLTELAENLKKGDSRAELVRMELRKASRPFSLQEVAEKLHMQADELKAAGAQGGAGFEVYDTPEGTFLFDANFSRNWSDKLHHILQEYHKENPVFGDGLDLVELIGKTGLSKSRADKAFMQAFLASLVNKGELQQRNSTWIIAGHKALIDQKTQEHLEWLEGVIHDYGSQKPVLIDIEEKAVLRKLPKTELKMLLSYLVKKGKVVYFQQDFIHTHWLNTYRKVLLSMLDGQEQGIAINDFKDRMDASKRFCAILVGLYETEKIIRTMGSGIDTRIFITQHGKNTYAGLS